MDWREHFFSSTYDLDSLENRDEALIKRLVGWVDWLKRYHRAEVRGVSQIPAGAGLYVANHNAGTITVDSYLFAGEVFRQRGMADMPYGLGHEWAMRVPLAHEFMARMGAVRACHENAQRLFEAGHKVLVYPGGDVDSCRPFRDRNRIVFDGREGYIRLALRTGVPIIPVVSCGAHSTWIVLSDMRWLAKLLRIDEHFRIKVCPLVFSLPWGVTLGFPLPYIPFPVRILIEVLEPIHFERSGEEAAADEAYVAACAAQVESAMQACLDRLAAERAAG